MNVVNYSDLHPIQKDILRVLMYKPEARFSELNTQGVTSDHFNFHVKRLVELGLLEKKADEGYYILTAIGKEFANRFDSDSKAMSYERQPKMSVIIGCVKEEGGVRKYLTQRRLKQPFYGFLGFMSGKVRWGDDLAFTAARELKEEMGVEARMTLCGVWHRMDYSLGDVLLEDKYFFVFRGDDARGELVQNFEGGENRWLSEEEIFALPNFFHGVGEVIKIFNQEGFVFVENKYKVEKY